MPKRLALSILAILLLAATAGRPAVRGQCLQGVVPSSLLPLGAEDIAKERRLLQHQGGGHPRRAQAVQGLYPLGRTET